MEVNCCGEEEETEKRPREEKTNSVWREIRSGMRCLFETKDEREKEVGGKERQNENRAQRSKSTRAQRALSLSLFLSLGSFSFLLRVLVSSCWSPFSMSVHATTTAIAPKRRQAPRKQGLAEHGQTLPVAAGVGCSWSGCGEATPWWPYVPPSERCTPTCSTRLSRAHDLRRHCDQSPATICRRTWHLQYPERNQHHKKRKALAAAPPHALSSCRRCVWVLLSSFGLMVVVLLFSLPFSPEILPICLGFLSLVLWSFMFVCWGGVGGVDGGLLILLPFPPPHSLPCVPSLFSP